MDKADGRGRMTHANGDYYEGDWKADRAQGKGIFVGQEASYEGEWANDKQHGTGIETWANGSRYVGQFRFGKKGGKGRFEFEDESYYDGEFVDGNF